MKKVINIAFLANRTEFFKDLIRSIIEQPQLDDWEVVVLFQCLTPADFDEIQSEGLLTRISKYHMAPKPLGPHVARYHLLRMHMGDVNCVMDDDMVMLDTTDYNSAIPKVLEIGTGLVSTNWYPFDAWRYKKTQQEKYIAQPIVYTGGGMLFSRNIAELIIKLGPVPHRDDNTTWSLQTYLNGYTNYRYLGSISKHMVCRKGGGREWFNRTDLPDIDKKFLKLNGVNIGRSDQLTDLAKKIHKKNKLKL